MRARATVLQFWLSSLPNMKLVDLHKHCTLRRVLWFSKVKNVKTLSFSSLYRIYAFTFLPFQMEFTDTQQVVNTLAVQDSPL